jgi:hypothetical protein
MKLQALWYNETVLIKVTTIKPSEVGNQAARVNKRFQTLNGVTV